MPMLKKNIYITWNYTVKSPNLVPYVIRATTTHPWLHPPGENPCNNRLNTVWYDDFWWFLWKNEKLSIKKQLFHSSWFFSPNNSLNFQLKSFIYPISANENMKNFRSAQGKIIFSKGGEKLFFEKIYIPDWIFT